MRLAPLPKSSLFWLSFPSLFLLSPWTTLNNSSLSLLFTPFKYLWPMSQSLSVRASGHAGRLVSFIFPLKAVPPGLYIIFAALWWTPITFSIICLIFFVIHTAQENPLCLSLLAQNKMLMVVGRISAYRKQSRSLQPTGIFPCPGHRIHLVCCL